MAFDDLLYFREGHLSGSISWTNLTTDALKIDETPVAGLGINVVIPVIPFYLSVSATTSNTMTIHPYDAGLKINIYESDDNAQWTLIKTMPGTDSTDGFYKLAGSFWDRFYTDKDYVTCDVTILSVAGDTSTTLNFGKVDIRLTDRFAKYAGT